MTGDCVSLLFKSAQGSPNMSKRLAQALLESDHPSSLLLFVQGLGFCSFLKLVARWCSYYGREMER